MELSVFAMILGNLVFFAGLGFYLHVREGWVIWVAAAGGGAILLGSALATMDPLADPLLVAALPGLVGAGYAVLAAYNYMHGTLRADLNWRAHICVAIAALCVAGALVCALAHWPLRFTAY